MQQYGERLVNVWCSKGGNLAHALPFSLYQMHQLKGQCTNFIHWDI